METKELKIYEKELKIYEKEFLTELIDERIAKIDSGIISYGSKADNEEYKQVYQDILTKINNL